MRATHSRLSCSPIRPMRKVEIYGASVTCYTSDSKEGLVFWSSREKEGSGASQLACLRPIYWL